MEEAKGRCKRGASTLHFNEDAEEAASTDPPVRRVYFRRLKLLDNMDLHKVNADTVLRGGRDLEAETFERDEAKLFLCGLTSKDLSKKDLEQRKRVVRQLRDSVLEEARRVASEHRRLVDLARCSNKAVYFFNEIAFQVPTDPWALRRLSLNSFAAECNPTWFGTPNGKAERHHWRQWTNYLICGLSNRYELNDEGNAIFCGLKENSPWLRGQVVVQVGVQARITFGLAGLSQVMAQWRAAVDGLPWPSFRGISVYTLMPDSPGDLEMGAFTGLPHLEYEIDLARQGQPGSQQSVRFSQLIALRSAEERKSVPSTGTGGPAHVVFPRVPDGMCHSDWDSSSQFRDLPHSQVPEDFLRRSTAALGSNSSAFTELTQVQRGIPFYHSAVVRGRDKINKRPRGIPKLLPLLPKKWEERDEEEEDLGEIDVVEGIVGLN